MMTKQLLIFLFDFRGGRVNRTCWWVMFCIVIPLLCLMPSIEESQAVETVPKYFAYAATGILSWIFWAVGAKRCHDRDKSGWIQLLIIFPIIGFFWYLYELGFVRGNPWPNRFGCPINAEGITEEEV